MSESINLAKAYVQIIPSAQGIKSGIEKEFGGAGDSTGKLLGGNLVKKAMGIISAAGIGAAIVSGIKASLEQGAALQQSLGGIETLFKDSADTMISYANNAFKTAGLSATEYMDTATSFAASLLQGLGGDTKKAADISNMAITDMSDNANKFGTDMQRIQDAYQGFAKQNYTMLDNLKLGYGGTKTEMQRLLKDAQAISGVKYDITNLSDVYSAIHVIQQELGVTGTTAKEAASTFSGSFMAMKASWKNVLAVLSNGGDLENTVKGLSASVSTFLFRNLFPMIGNVIKQIPGAIKTFVVESIPTISEIGGNIVSAMKDGFFVKLPEMLDNAPLLIEQFTQRLTEKLDTMMQNGDKMLSNIGQGFLNGFPKVVVIIGQLIGTMMLALAKILPKLLQFGITMLVKLAVGLVTGIPKMVAKVPEIFQKLKAKFEAMDWKSVGKNIVLGIINGIKNAAGSLVTTMKNLAKEALGSSKEELRIHSPSDAFSEEVGEMIPPGVAGGVKKNMGYIKKAMNQMSQETIGMAKMDLRTSGVQKQPEVTVQEMDYKKMGQVIAEVLAGMKLMVKLGDREVGRVVRAYA